MIYDAKWLNRIAYKLFVTLSFAQKLPLFFDYATMFDARAGYDMRQVSKICSGESNGTMMNYGAQRTWPGNSQLASLDG